MPIIAPSRLACTEKRCYRLWHLRGLRGGEGFDDTWVPRLTQSALPTGTIRGDIQPFSNLGQSKFSAATGAGEGTTATTSGGGATITRGKRDGDGPRADGFGGGGGIKAGGGVDIHNERYYYYYNYYYCFAAKEECLIHQR